MTDPPPDPAELVPRLEALTRDRDYWRAQHDAVMADWKADVDEWARLQAELRSAPEPSAAHEALLELLRFFDPETGAVTTRAGDQTWSEAFLRASWLTRP